MLSGDRIHESGLAMSYVTDTQLQQLRPGDRLKYYGVRWQVRDYSTFTDPQGYETEEWLLKADTGKAYYLLREYDPANSDQLVRWYIAEELQAPTIVEPGSARDLLPHLADAMWSEQQPYPELRVFNRIYLFESSTQGSYESDDETTNRVTWDYWDATRLWNLALEAWSDRTLEVYSTREVQLADFSEIQTADVDAVGFSTSNSQYSVSVTNVRTVQLVCAWLITIVGFLFIFIGI